MKALPKDEQLPSLKPLLMPKHWPSWLVVGLLWLWSRLPFAWGMAISRSFKPLIKRLMKKRVAIIERNLEACFPEKSDAERAQLLDENLTALASMLGETIYTWWRGKSLFSKYGEINGFEHIQALQAQGKGIVLLMIHSTSMEFGSGQLTTKMPFSAVYRPHTNPVMEYVVVRGREGISVSMISKRDIRTAIKTLRRGGALWYASDLDVKGEQSLFVPFFGIQTATMTAPLRLIKAGKAAVVPMVPIRQPGNHYRLEIFPPIDGLTGKDEIADLSRINQAVEKMVRLAPEQYWWVHRRFKTRPPGEAPFYSE